MRRVFSAQLRHGTEEFLVHFVEIDAECFSKFAQSSFRIIPVKRPLLAQSLQVRLVLAAPFLLG